MHRREKQVREHSRPDEDDLRDEAEFFAPDLSASKSSTIRQSRPNWVLRLAIPILSLIVVGLLLTGCEIGVAFGLPRNDECRDVETSPGDPISKECLDTIGQPTIGP